MKLSVLATSMASIMLSGAQPGYSQFPADVSQASHDLVLVLRERLSTYSDHHPEVRRSQALLKMLERADQAQPDDFEKLLARAISDEIENLQEQSDSYSPHHPSSRHDQANIELLTRDLHNLQLN